MKQIWQTRASSITLSSVTFPCIVEAEAGISTLDCALQNKTFKPLTSIHFTAHFRIILTNSQPHGTFPVESPYNVNNF
jgi:hypothetical protein